MSKTFYKLGFEIGACFKLLTSKEALGLWLFITLIYFMKGI